MSEEKQSLLRNPINGDDEDTEPAGKIVHDSDEDSSDDEDDFGNGGKKMSLFTLVFLSYFCVCGGPYGLEVAVNAGYPLLTFIALLVVPWAWGFPLAMMTAELSAAMPSNDGFILWIKRGHGVYFGFMSGYVSWINSIVDVALYPVIFISYLQYLIPNMSYVVTNIVHFGTILAVMILNIIGIDIVGKFSIVFTIIVIAPFIMMLAWALIERKIHYSYFLDTPPDYTKSFSAVPWSVFINTIAWGYGGYDDVGNVAEELENPQRDFPRAMIILIFLSIATYVLGMVAAVGIVNNYAEWEDGYFSSVAYTLGGRWFEIVVIIGAMISSLGQFNALLCVTGQELRAIGKKDMLGIKWIAQKNSKTRTPILALVISTVLVAIMTKFQFGDLVQLDNALYSFVMLLEYTTLIKMRYTHKDMERPFRISKSNAATIALLIPPMIFCCYIIIATVMSSWYLAAMYVGVLGSGSILYACLYFGRKFLKKREEERL